MTNDRDIHNFLPEGADFYDDGSLSQKKDADKSTARPWEAFNHYVWTPSKQNIANCKNVQEGNPMTAEETYANAELIVKAVNSYDELIALVKLMNEHEGAERWSKGMKERIEKALKLAEGEG